MRNTGYNKLQLVLIVVKDWGNFLKFGKSPQKASRKKTGRQPSRQTQNNAVHVLVSRVNLHGILGGQRDGFERLGVEKRVEYGRGYPRHRGNGLRQA